MRSVIRWFLVGVGVMLAGCASQPPKPTILSAEPAATLPTPNGHFSKSVDWYPPEAKRQSMRGRVHLVFHLDGSGRPMAVQPVDPTGPPLLQASAIEFIKAATFVPAQSATGSEWYRAIIWYCLPKCDGTPAKEDITISGSPIIQPKQGH